MKDKNLIYISLFFLVLSIILFGKTGNMMIDFSREIYIPFQLNSNKVLFKDIFLIYGFFGYFINSLIYKISINISHLLVLANILSYLSALLIYLIISNFLSKKESLIFTLFFIAISIFNASTFSMTLPYSFSTLWAVLGSYLALFCLIKDKTNILYLTLGLISVSKIEYFIPIFIFSIAYQIYFKKFKAKNFLLFFIFPLIQLIYILLNNISIEQIINNFAYIKKMVKTNSLNYLYSGMGVYFQKAYFLFNIKNLIFLTATLILAYYIHKKNHPIISYLITFLYLIFASEIFRSFNLIFFINLGLLIYLICKKLINQNELILGIFSLILISKTIFATNCFNYSNYGFILTVVFSYICLSKILNKNFIKNTLIIYLTLLSLTNFIFILQEQKTKLKTNIGNIYISKQDFETFKNTNAFIKENIKENETLVVLPEGQIFNLINKKDWNFFNSTFTPLDFETFEPKLTEKLKEKNTNYIIIYPRNIQDYTKGSFCIDYGVDFCNFIKDNYTKVENNIENVLIYKLEK